MLPKESPYQEYDYMCAIIECIKYAQIQKIKATPDEVLVPCPFCDNLMERV